MDQLNKYLSELESLPNSIKKTNVKKRITLIEKFKKAKEKEETKLQNILNDQLWDTCRDSLKYKNKSIDELLDLFESSDLDDKIIIFQSIQFKINKLNSELFSNDNSEIDDSTESNSSEMEYSDE